MPRYAIKGTIRAEANDIITAESLEEARAMAPDVLANIDLMDHLFLEDDAYRDLTVEEIPDEKAST